MRQALISSDGPVLDTALSWRGLALERQTRRAVVLLRRAGCG